MISKNRIKWLRGLQQKKQRRAEMLFVAEGPKLVGELMSAGFECVYVAATTLDLLPQVEEREGLCMETVSDEELRRVSSVETPQGVLAVFRQPQYEMDPVAVASESLCLALDDVQNPGNLGTIVRLADWFGISDVFCSRGCADLYNPKTIQATMGALAHVRVHYVDLVELLDSVDAATPVYGTFLDGENIYEKHLRQCGIVVMGNEGNGISAETARRVTERLYIPSFRQGHVESLNVAMATAVVCAEFRRQAL